MATATETMTTAMIMVIATAMVIVMATATATAPRTVMLSMGMVHTLMEGRVGLCSLCKSRMLRIHKTACNCLIVPSFVHGS